MSPTAPPIPLWSGWIAALPPQTEVQLSGFARRRALGSDESEKRVSLCASGPSDESRRHGRHVRRSPTGQTRGPTVGRTASASDARAVHPTASTPTSATNRSLDQQA